MSMEVGEEDQILVAKEKRTKIQKLEMSPNYFSEPNCELLGQCHSFFNFSSSNSQDGGRGDGDSDDDVDMANCLILLAQGLPASRASSSLGKFISDPKGPNGASKAAGGCAYECKTCGRTFPSFQALGGHRSSHKSAAMAAAADHKPISGTESAYRQQQHRFNNDVSNQFDQLRKSRSDYYYNKFKLIDHKNKVHECSVCGAEFISGQALGGHMRHHRRGYGGASRDSSEIDRRCPKKQRSNLLCLDLNLNLPAPEDDTREKSGAVAMAATKFVDCHY